MCKKKWASLPKVPVGTKNWRRYKTVQDVQKQRGIPSWVIFSATICFSTTICVCLEEAEREIFLQPRNFNPHPLQAGYEAGIQAGGNTGPVLFPETPPDPDDPNGNSGNINADRDNRLPIDSHPYASVVRKSKYKQAGRFHSNIQESHASPQVLKALTSQAAKILKKTSTSDVVNPTYSHYKKAYTFSYKVKDQFSGDDFSHVQQQNAKATNGEYRVKLPDGRLQIVSYVADKNGYKADVKYAENENSNPKAYPSEHIQTQQIRPIQIAQNRIKAKAGHYDYVYEDYPTDSNLQTQLPLYGEDYGTSQLPLYPPHDDGRISVSGLKDRNLVQLIVTPATPKVVATPTYENQLQINPYLVLHNNIQAQSIPEQKVELFGNIHDRQKVVQISEHSLNSEKVGKFIGSTLAPYTLDSSKGFQQNVLSTFTPADTGRYSQFQIHTPNFRFVQKQHHQHLYYK